MFTIRRNDHTPRVEMLPLIDVIFLLLTFFIYSLIMMVEAQVLPVTLTPVMEGQVVRNAVVQVITIDSKGDLYFNREPIAVDALTQELEKIAAMSDSPPLYLAMEAKGEVDRGPLFLKLIELARAAGIQNFEIVGTPGSTPAPGNPGSAP